MILSTEIARRPNGSIREVYPLLFGLRLGDFWLALALNAGVAWMIGRTVWPAGYGILQCLSG